LAVPGIIAHRVIESPATARIPAGVQFPQVIGIILVLVRGMPAFRTTGPV